MDFSLNKIEELAAFYTKKNSQPILAYQILFMLRFNCKRVYTFAIETQDSLFICCDRKRLSIALGVARWFGIRF